VFIGPAGVLNAAPHLLPRPNISLAIFRSWLSRPIWTNRRAFAERDKTGDGMPRRTFVSCHPRQLFWTVKRLQVPALAAGLRAEDLAPDGPALAVSEPVRFRHSMEDHMNLERLRK
jgi:hypothetical protein